jgi:HEAT repeat protein
MRDLAAAMIGRAAIALFLVPLLGCAPKTSQSIEPPLVDAVEEVPEQDPMVILEEGAGHLDPTSRALALGWLTRLSPTEDAVSWAARSLYDPSAWVQRAGVLALLDRLEQPPARQALSDYVVSTSGDPYIRSMAGIGLAEHRSNDISAALREAWRGEQEPWIIAPLALASAAHGDAEAIPAVAKALATGELALDLDFLKAVGASGHADLLPALQTGSAMVEDELRLPLAIAQVQLGDPSAEQVLRKALQHSDPIVRMGAVELLAELDHPTAGALLAKARNDKVLLVQSHARMALAARNGDDHDAFAKAWQDPDREVRALCVRLAAQAAADPVAGSNKKLMRVVDEIMPQALRDPDATVRLQAVRAAARLMLTAQVVAVAVQTRQSWAQLRIEAAGAALLLGYPPRGP